MSKKRKIVQNSIAEIRALCQSGKYSSEVHFAKIPIDGTHYDIRVSWHHEKGAMVAEMVSECAIEGHGMTLRMPKKLAAQVTKIIKDALSVQHVTGIVDTEYIPINEQPPFAPTGANKKPTR